MKEMEFDVRLYQDEDSVWIAECPAIPGCVSQGASEEEALANIEDAIKGCLQVRQELGMPAVVQHRIVRISA
jgi:predicted RNase H-like HicB family nuclease